MTRALIPILVAVISCRGSGHVDRSDRVTLPIADADIIVVGKLLAKSRLPNLREYHPQRDMQAAAIWEVTEVVQGAVTPSRIIVAHWAAVDASPWPDYENLKVGQSYRLAVEPLTASPEHSHYLRFDDFEDDTLFSESLDHPAYYENGMIPQEIVSRHPRKT